MNPVEMRRIEREKRRRWLAEAGVYALLYGLPFVALFPYTHWRPDADINAAIKASAVDFTVGKYSGAGPFLATCADVTFERPARAELPASVQWKPLSGSSPGGSADSLWGGTLRFRNVDLKSIFLPQGSKVRIEWFDASPGGATIKIVYPGGTPVPAATVFMDETSSVQFDSSSFSQSGGVATGSITGTADTQGMVSLWAKDDLRFPISISPCSRNLKTPAGDPAHTTSSITASASSPTVAVSAGSVVSASTLSAAISAAINRTTSSIDKIPLLEGSQISFLTDNGDTSILGIDNTLEISNADRKSSLPEGRRLEIGSIKNRNPRDQTQISLQIKDGIAARVLGSAGLVQVDNRDERPSLAEYLLAQKVLSAWLATTILIGSAALTVANRIKLFKLDEKEK